MIDIDNLDDVDAVLAAMIQQAQRPFTAVETIAVQAIICLSMAGAALMTDASHADSRDTVRLSVRAQSQLQDARWLMSQFIREREHPYEQSDVEPEPWHPYEQSDPAVNGCDHCGEDRRLHP